MNFLKVNYKTKNIDFLKVIFSFVFVWGMIVIWLIPTWQVPDEGTHLNLIGESLGIEGLGNNWQEKCSVGFDRIIRNSDEKIDKNEYVESFKIYSDSIRFSSGKPCIKLSIIKHLPATIGIIIGMVLNLPILIILMFGEIFSLAFYVFVCYWAVKIMPVKKELLLLICTMPMCIQEAASISYDSVFLPMGFLYIAYLLFLKLEKEKICIYDILILLGILVIVTYIKLPFMFLGLLIFSLPTEKIKIDVRGRYLSVKTVNYIFFSVFIASVVLGMSLLFACHGVFWIDLLRECLLNTERIIQLFYNTLLTFKNYLAESFVGKLGWLDTNMPQWYIYSVWIVLFFFSIYNDSSIYCKELKIKHKVINLLVWGSVFVSTFYLTMISMINHTYTVMTLGYETGDVSYDIKEALYTIPYIGGIQGRYFILTILVLMLLLPSIKKKNKMISRMLVGAYIFVTFIVMVYTLINRYWM